VNCKNSYVIDRRFYYKIVKSKARHYAGLAHFCVADKTAARQLLLLRGVDTPLKRLLKNMIFIK
jgi:hypothetical protein